MASKLASDPRIDPRLKAMFGAMPEMTSPGDAKDRDQLLAEVSTEAAKTQQAMQKQMFDAIDTEAVASFQGLTIRTATFTSQPDGNQINIQFIRPENAETLP